MGFMDGGVRACKLDGHLLDQPSCLHYGWTGKSYTMILHWRWRQHSDKDPCRMVMSVLGSRPEMKFGANYVAGLFCISFFFAADRVKRASDGVIDKVG